MTKASKKKGASIPEGANDMPGGPQGGKPITPPKKKSKKKGGGANKRSG